MASRPSHEPPLAARRAAWAALWRVLLAPPYEAADKPGTDGDPGSRTDGGTDGGAA